jgi:hypothetical protein
MSELKIKMQNVEIIATLVIQQQKEFENNPRHNEYMQLAWNLDSLKSAIQEVEFELNITKG